MNYWMQTYGGGVHDLRDLSANSYEPEEIAGALSQICRYGGHCKEFYSVAYHSLVVYLVVRDQFPEDYELQLAALLHDAHEAFTGFGDVPRPVKRMMREECPELLEYISKREDAVDAAIAEKYGFSPKLFHSSVVKQADLVLLATEKRDVMDPSDLEWEPLPNARGIPLVCGPSLLPSSKISFLTAFKTILKVRENAKARS